MKENKRGRFALILSVLLHIIVLTALGRLLPSGESAPMAMLEFELISTVQAAEYPSPAPEISAPPASAAPSSVNEPVAKQPTLPAKKPAETVSPANVKTTTANTDTNNNGVSFAQTAQSPGDSGQIGSAGSGDNSSAAAPPKILKPPQLLHKVEPTYPENARRQNLEGKVVVRLEVSKNGSVAQVAIEQSSGQQALDSAALAAVKNWRFVPARDANDAPMRSFTTVPVVFKLN